ncbi:PAS domain-containing sensor histidine kinase [Arcicella rigui]|uniref:histidine kinase n=1 Tax=Arcicella rigui TaxID=797020 RepID=A0ABU5QAM0_9BACT|nr:PAS domain S-box protein [Arcicella rigui]MEA5139434.1 PAS domain S-box protein [Arcicella rigui]
MTSTLAHTQDFLEKITENVKIAMFQFCLTEMGTIRFQYLSKVIEKVCPSVDYQSFIDNPEQTFRIKLGDNFEHFASSLKKANEELCTWEFECELVDDEKDINWIQIFASPHTDNGTTYWSGFFKNITQEKQTLENNIIREKRLSTIIENSTEGFALLNADGKIIEMSPSGKKILGLDVNENPGEIINKVTIHPDDRITLGQQFLQSIANPNEVEQCEFRILQPNGEYKWLETLIHNLLDEPNVNAIVLNYRDITERIQAKQQKEFDANNLKALIDNTSELVWSVDSSRKLISFNTAYENIVKRYGKIEVYPQMSIIETLKSDPVHLERYISYYDRALAGETFTVQYEYHSKTDDSAWREVSFYPIRVGEKVIGTACFGKDITERKNAELALQKTNEQLNAAQQLAHFGYWEIDLIHNDHHWSEEMYNIFEIDAKQPPLNLNDAIKYVHPEDRTKILEEHSLMMNEDKYLNFDFRLLMPDGRVKYLLMNAKMVKEEDGTKSKIKITSKDVSQRKKVEMELIESEKRFKALIENSTEGIAIVNDAGTITEISAGGKKMFNINNLEEFSINAIHPEDIEKLSNIYYKVYEDPTYSPTANFRYVRPSGETIWIETNFNNQLSEPSIKGIVMNFRDITERKIVEKALKKERKLLRNIIDNLPFNIYVKDLKTRKILANKSEWEFVGAASESEVLGKTDFELFSEESAVQSEIDDLQVMKNDRSIINKETLCFDAHGNKVWYLISKIPLKNESNEVDGLLGLNIDITKQKAVQEKLTENEEMFRELAKSVPGVVFQFYVEANGDTYFSYLSTKMYEFFGVPDDFSVSNMSKYIYYKDRVRFEESVLEAIQYKRDWNFEGRTQTPSLGIRWFHGMSTPTVKEDRMIFNGILLDITERKKAEEDKKQMRRLEISLEKEREINIVKSRFISFASHEFRTPLATITTSIDIIGIYANMMNDESLREKIQYHLNKVVFQAHRITQMLTDILLLEKASNEKLNIKSEQIDIVQFIENLNHQNYTDRNDGRKLELILPNEHAQILTDPILLDHILCNLINNAFKFSKGARDPELILKYEESKLKISIKDYGIGIPEKDQKHLFEIFFRANNAIKIEGTGLGLNLTREFAHKLGGNIAFDSKEGEGTVFILTLPYDIQG